MNTNEPSNGDPAALSAAVVAGAIAVFMTPGPYSFLSGVLGLTLLFLVWGYARGKERTVGQSLAFAGVVSFSLLLVIGLLLEMYYGGGLPRGTYHNIKGNISAVPDWLIAVGWVVLTPTIWCYDMMRQGGDAVDQP